MALNPSPSNLDQQQIIQRVMDGANDRLRVDATVTATIGDVTISAEDSNIAIKDPVSGNILKVNADGSIDANTIITAASGDSILSVGTDDGTLTGTQKVLKIDNTGALVVNSSGTSTVSGTVNTNLNGLNVWSTSQVSVGTTAVQLAPSPLSTRSSISVKAMTTGTNMVYVGNSAAVTTSTGYALFNGDSIQLDLTPTGNIWAIASAAGQTVFVLQLGS